MRVRQGRRGRVAPTGSVGVEPAFRIFSGSGGRGHRRWTRWSPVPIPQSVSFTDDVRTQTQLPGVFLGHTGTFCRVRASARVSHVSDTTSRPARLSSELHCRIVRAGSGCRLRSRCRPTFRRGHVSAGVRVRGLPWNHRCSAGATQARDSIVRLDPRPALRASSSAWPAFQLMFVDVVLEQWK